MRPIHWLVTAAAFLIVATLVHGQTPVPRPGAAAPKTTALITGQVIDAETGSPVAGVVVAITSTAATAGRAESLARVLTDGQGRFFFDELAAGQYTLDGTKAGWIPGAFGRRRPGGGSLPVDLKEDERRGGLTISMWRYGIISGRAIDEQGEALIGADVRLFQQSFAAGRGQMTFVTRAIADDRGAFRFASLLPGDYLVAVPATVTSEPPGLSAQASTPSSYFQTMTAVGASPMGLRRAEVATRGDGARVASMLTPVPPPSADAPWTTYATTFFPSAISAGLATTIHVGAGRERAGIDVVVRMTQTHRVSGAVTNPDGTPASFHAVHLLPADSANRPLFDVATAVTDAAGQFTFSGVPAGQFIARVVRVPLPAAVGMQVSVCGGTGAIEYVCAFSRGPGAGAPAVASEPLLSVDQPVQVGDRDVRGLAMTLRPGAKVAGRAEFEGTAARPADAQWGRVAVVLERADGQTNQQPGGPDLTQPGRFSNEGKFTTPSSWPGRYLLRVTGPPPGWTFKSATSQGHDLAETPFDLTSDIDDVVITFTDHAGTIEGAVQGADGQPDSGALVLLFPSDPAGWVDYGRTSRRVRSVSAPGGKFSMPVPPGGEYLLIAVPDDQAQDWQNPAFLEKVAALADRVRIADGESSTHALQTRRIQ